MNKRGIKVIFVLLSTLMLISLTTMTLAYSNPSLFGGKTSNTGSKIQGGANVVIGIIQAIGIAAAVIMLIMVAIKYVSAAPGEKADIKKSIIIYVIGAVLLFAATGILGIIQGFATDVTGTSTGTCLECNGTGSVGDGERCRVCGGDGKTE